MYTQSSLRALCKVAQLIQDNPEYSDYILESFGMEKEAGKKKKDIGRHGRAMKKKMRGTGERLMRGAEENLSMPYDEIEAMKKVDPDAKIRAVPNPGQPGRPLAVSDAPNAHPGARLLEQKYRQQMGNMTPEAIVNFQANETVAKHNAASRLTPEAMNNFKRVIEEKTYKGKPVKGVSGAPFGKFKGGEPVTNAQGVTIPASDYVSPYHQRNAIATAARDKRQEVARVNSMIGDFKQNLPGIKERLAQRAANRQAAIGGLRKKQEVARVNSMIGDFKQNLPGIKERLAQRAANRQAAISKIRGLKLNNAGRLSKFFNKLGPKGKWIAGVLGATTLGAGSAAMMLGSNSDAPASEYTPAEVPVMDTPTTGNNNYNLYSNIGTGAAGILGGVAGHEISRALGGGTATNLLVGLLSGAVSAYGGRKGTQWLLDNGYIG